MRKTILRAMSAVAMLTMSLGASAQLTTYVGSRFIVNATGPVNGQKIGYTISNDGTGAAGEWGGAITMLYDHVPLIKAVDSLGCPTTISNGAAIAGNFALIRRGDCEFSQKALEAQNNGAIGVIIANKNVGEGAVGMGAGTSSSTVTIPVIMVSTALGDSLYAAINSGDAVTISLTPWGFGNANDLTIVPNSGALGHAMAIPYPQLAADNGDPLPYNFFNSVLVANTGTSDQTGVLFTQTATFYPTSGSPSTLFADTITLETAFTTLDSVLILQNPANANQAHVNQTGTLKVVYDLMSDAADDLPVDNIQEVDIAITDSIFCRGRYDLANHKPVTQGAYQFSAAAGSPTMVWGPMFYIAKGGYVARDIQFVVADNDTTTGHSLSGDVSYYLEKWVDANDDSVVEYSELTTAGIGSYSFVTGNHNFDPITSPINQSLSSSAPPALEANTWYFLALQADNSFFVGYDNVNYFTRNRAGRIAADEFKVADFWSAQMKNDFEGSTVDLLNMIPFSLEAEDYSLDSFGYFSGDIVPAIAMLMSKDPVGVGQVKSNIHSVTLYPMPVTDVVNVHINLGTSAKKITYQVTDIAGHVVNSGNVVSPLTDLTFQLPAATLAPGSYLVTIDDGQNQMTQRFVKAGH